MATHARRTPKVSTKDVLCHFISFSGAAGLQDTIEMQNLGRSANLDFWSMVSWQWRDEPTPDSIKMLAKNLIDPIGPKSIDPIG